MALYFTFLSTILTALSVIVLVILGLWGIQAGTWLVKDTPQEQRNLDKLFFGGLVSKLPPCSDGDKVTGTDLVMTLLLWCFIVFLILILWPATLVIGGIFICLKLIQFSLRWARAVKKNVQNSKA